MKGMHSRGVVPLQNSIQRQTIGSIITGSMEGRGEEKCCQWSETQTAHSDRQQWGGDSAYIQVAQHYMVSGQKGAGSREEQYFGAS